MAYRLCPSWDQKALSVATRCPHCGLAFGTGEYRHPPAGSKPRRIPSGLIVVGVVLTVLVGSTLRRILNAPPPDSQPSPVVSAPPPAPKPPSESPGVVPDTQRAAPPQPPSEPSPPIVAPAPAPAPGPAQAQAQAAELVDSNAPQRLYASTWINVRADRSNAAPVIRILRPGEVVLVGVQEQGWYRVVNDEQAIGYVDRRYLDAAPPVQP